MQTEKKVLSGFVNQDDAPEKMAAEEILLARNMRYGTTQTGATGQWETILGDAECPTLNAEGFNTTLGSAESPEGRYIVYFNHNSNGNHGIYLYYKPTNQTFPVLLNSGVTGGLGFDLSHRIEARITDHKLYFTDNNLDPRHLNIFAAVRAANSGNTPIDSDWDYTYPLNREHLTLIKLPPTLAPSVVKLTNLNFHNNFIQAESFQFSFQFEYYDGEQTVLSTFSRSTFLNTKEDTSNFVRVAMDIGQPIPASVKAVYLIAKFGTTSKCCWVKKWDNTVDSFPISQHQAGTTALSYDFYNDTYGAFLDDNLSVKPFESIPNKAKSIEIARHRLFLGNILRGYNTPAATSLSLSASAEPTNTSFVTQVIKVQIRYTLSGATWYYTAAYYYITGITQEGYYEDTFTATSNTVAYDWEPPQTSARGYNHLTYKGKTQIEVVNAVVPGGGTFQQFDFSSQTNTITVQGLPVSSMAATLFKSASTIQYGIVFYDQYLRKCGVVTNDSLKLYIEGMDFGATSSTTSVNWTLNGSNGFSEIPDWAYYYSIVRTNNLRTRNFLQSYDRTMKYATQDSDGKFTYSDTWTANATVAVAVSTTALLQSNLGYTFNDGDVCILIREDNQRFELPVLAEQGSYIHLKPQDLGTLTDKAFRFEIYTPYHASAQEGFYEIGYCYPVSNPTTGSRTYSVLGGTTNGDVFLIARTFNGFIYYAEAMCPQDKYWKRWDTDAGRINLVTNTVPRHLPSAVLFSNTFTEETKNNGLSNFEPLNEKILPLEMGEINSLILANKAESEGTVMLSIGAQKACSLYLGETRVTNADQSTYFVSSADVIGYVNELRGDYGTLHPESVVAYRGRVFWFSLHNSAFVQYSNNGLDPISDYKLRKFAKTLSQKLGTGTVTGGIDPYHEEVLWSIPRLAPLRDPNAEVPTQTPVAYLPDYPNEPYPYDLFDYGEKTIVYKIGASKWQGFYTFTAENFTTLENELYRFAGGILRLHNVPGNNLLDGQPLTGRLMIAVAGNPSMPKTFQSIAVESSGVPEWTHLRTETPDVQSSDLITEDYSTREGVHYAGLLRDRLDPNETGTPDERMMKGEQLRGTALKVLLQFTAPAYVREINILFNNSTGHNL